MLNHIPKALPPKLVKWMMEMGHNDGLVVCDANFPRFAMPRRVVCCPGAGAVQMLDAVLTLMPLELAGTPVTQMAVSAGDDYDPVIWPEYDAVLEKRAGEAVSKTFLDREDFYAAARNAYAAVVTGDTAFYATLILKKGCVV